MQPHLPPAAKPKAKINHHRNRSPGPWERELRWAGAHVVLPMLIVPTVIGVGLYLHDGPAAALLTPVDVAFAAFIIVASETLVIWKSKRWVQNRLLPWAIIGLVGTFAILVLSVAGYLIIEGQNVTGVPTTVPTSGWVAAGGALFVSTLVAGFVRSLTRVR